MWLYLITVVAFIGGLFAALGGIGPVAIILFIVGLFTIGGKIVGNSRGRTAGDVPTSGQTMSSTGGAQSAETPQDTVHTPKSHVKTGVAHSGQAQMTPDQERLPG